MAVSNTAVSVLVGYASLASTVADSSLVFSECYIHFFCPCTLSRHLFKLIRAFSDLVEGSLSEN